MTTCAWCQLHAYYQEKAGVAQKHVPGQAGRQYLGLEIVPNHRNMIQESVGQNLSGLISLGVEAALALEGPALALHLGTCSQHQQTSTFPCELPWPGAGPVRDGLSVQLSCSCSLRKPQMKRMQLSDCKPFRAQQNEPA